MNTYSITRYRIRQTPDCSSDSTMPALLKNAFIGIDDQAAETQSTGWVELFDHLATDFSPEAFMFGNIMAFSLRRDVRKVQAKTVARYLSIRIQKWVEKNGRRPNRLALKEMKELVKLDLLMKAPVDTELFRVFWLKQENEVWFMGQGEKRREWFESLWAKTFGGRIEPMMPFVKALEMKQEAAQALKVDPGGIFLDNWLNSLWLGRDFLLWLWADSERHEILDFGQELTLSIKFTGKMALADKDGKITCVSRNDRWSEAHTAITEGKQIESARILLTTDDKEFDFVLSADTLLPKSIKLPRAFAGNDEDGEVGEMLEHISLLAELQAALDALFRIFLEKRLCSDWDDEHLPEIKVWSFDSSRSMDAVRGGVKDFAKHVDARLKSIGMNDVVVAPVPDAPITEAEALF